MVSTLALADPRGAPREYKYEATLDLAKLAVAVRGDRIKIEHVADRTLELFNRTLRLVDDCRQDRVRPGPDAVDAGRFVPEHEDLRKRFLFAEALGSYAALHNLLDGYCPAYRLSVDYADKARIAALTKKEVQVLEEYHDQIHKALVHANQYLQESLTSGYTEDELHELISILMEARDRCETLTAIIGTHLIIEVETAVRKLYEIQEKIRAVQRTIDGIFLVDSEVMFIPTDELIEIVNNIFNAIGNPFVAENIDGLLLLAARNLLIQAIAFHSYYGKQQIYNVFAKKHTTISRGLIAHHIRSEIRKLFKACKASNKLVLTRVVNAVEEEFQISVSAIQTEAEQSAVEAVDLLIPKEPPPPPPTKPGIFARLAAWLFR
jgi:hypothetical protein